MPRASSQGAFTGRTLATGRGDLVRAVLEGVAYQVRTNLEAMASRTAPPRAVAAFGGGARSPLWRQVLADVLGLPVGVTDTVETACLGAAMCAAVAAAVFPSLAEARQAMNGGTTWLTPNPSSHVAYREQAPRLETERCHRQAVQSSFMSRGAGPTGRWYGNSRRLPAIDTPSQRHHNHNRSPGCGVEYLPVMAASRGAFGGSMTWREQLRGKTIHLVFYCHADWQWEQSRLWHVERYVLSLRECLDWLDRTADLTLVLDNISEYLEPVWQRLTEAERERVRDMVRQGRIGIAPAGIANGRPTHLGDETFIRNLILGRRAFRQYFPEADLGLFQSVDVSIGHSQMPQLLRLAGFDAYRAWRPEAALDADGVPRQFVWRGLDGSEIPVLRGALWLLLYLRESTHLGPGLGGGGAALLRADAGAPVGGRPHADDAPIPLRRLRRRPPLPHPRRRPVLRLACLPAPVARA